MKTNALIHLKGYKTCLALTCNPPKVAVTDIDLKFAVHVTDGLSFLPFTTSNVIKGIRKGEEMMEQDCCILTREGSFTGTYILCVSDTHYLCINSSQHRPNFIEELTALEDARDRLLDAGHDIIDRFYEGASDHKHKMALERIRENVSYSDYQEIMEDNGPQYQFPGMGDVNW